MVFGHKICLKIYEQSIVNETRIMSVRTDLINAADAKHIGIFS